MEEMLQRNSSDNLDNKRLKALLDEKSSEMDKTKYELDVLNDQHSNLKKEVKISSFLYKFSKPDFYIG